MRGPGGAFVLVSLQMLVGAFVFMLAAFFGWKIINRGYYRSTVWVLWPLLVAVSLLLPGDLLVVGVGTGIAFAAFLAAVYTQRPLLEWITGLAASAAGLYLIAVAGLDACVPSCVLGAVHSIGGMVLVGAVTHAMVLGHWYLNQARLPIEPLKQHTLILFAAIAMSGILGIATREGLLAGESPAGIFTFASSSYWWTWLFILTATAGLGAMIWATVKERSTQSATGLLYIAIVNALGAQFILNLLVAT